MLTAPIEWLPPDLVSTCLGYLGSQADLGSAARVCKAWRALDASDTLWEKLYSERFPAWLLFKLKAELAASTSKEKFKLHLRAMKEPAYHTMYLEFDDYGVKHLLGVTTDEFDGNETPCEVLLGMAPRGRLSDVLDIQGKVLAVAKYGKGSKHNEPGTRCWIGDVRLHPGHTDYVLIWRERSSLFGEWIFTGRVTPRGDGISGHFYLSIMPRKRGSFVLTAAANSHPEEICAELGARPTPTQLTKHVAVKVCSNAIERAAARGELADAIELPD